MAAKCYLVGLCHYSLCLVQGASGLGGIGVGYAGVPDGISNMVRISSRSLPWSPCKLLSTKSWTGCCNLCKRRCHS